jgi:hypothetical protein
MLTGVLCSSNCAVEAVCQLFLLLLHAQGLCKTYTQPGTPCDCCLADLAQESAGNHPTTNLLSLNCSVACSCSGVCMVTAARTFVNHVNTAKLLDVYARIDTLE